MFFSWLLFLTPAHTLRFHISFVSHVIFHISSSVTVREANPPPVSLAYHIKVY